MVVTYLLVYIMGRYYHGSIEGKFWFGIQTSGDISNLVTITPEICYVWKVCSCAANIDDGYCKDCYDSKEEHEVDVIEEDGENEDNSLYIEAQMIIYRLKKDIHYNELKTTMDTLRLKIDPEVIAEFDKIEQNDKILDAFTGVFDNMEKKLNIIEKKKEESESSSLPTDHNELVARYTIGYQLEYCLRTTDEDCYVDCEC